MKEENFPNFNNITNIPGLFVLQGNAYLLIGRKEMRIMKERKEIKVRGNYHNSRAL